MNFAQETYAEDIAPIIYKNCSTCHRQGEIGPLSLTNYEEVANWGDMIKLVTESKYMPPWQPDPNVSSFIGETILTDTEINQIAEWVDNGKERGDIALEPSFPDFPEGSLLGEPDLVLEMKEAHLHKGNNRDSYYYFVLPTGLTQDRIVKSMEFRPGNAKIVHHALIFEDVNGIAASTDAQTSEYGFESFGSFNGDQNSIDFLYEKQYPAYAPGQKPLRYPEGLGQVLTAGADLAVQVHYAPSSSDEMDQSKINIFFADENEAPVDRFVDQRLFLPFELPGGFNSFFISAGDVKDFTGSWTVPSDISLMGTFPHMHLLGKEWEVWVDHTDGSRTDLISIPDWDFNWQAVYYFDRLIKAEQGAVIRARATYDNSSSNPSNPNNPPEFTLWGEGTEDEMYYIPFLYVPYQQGDEDILFTTSTDEIIRDVKNQIFPISPNPVNDYVNASFKIETGTTLSIAVYDISGNIIKHIRQGEYFHNGMHTVNFKTNEMPSGMYILSIKGKAINTSQKFVKQ